MDNRTKGKTEEELNNEVDSLEDDTTEDATDTTDEEDEDIKDDTTEEAEEAEEDESLDDKDEEDEEPKKPTKPQEEPIKKQSPDIEERLKESTREAQLLHERNNQLVSAFEEAEKITDPTDEDLKKYIATKGVEWEELSAFEKAMAKDNYINSQKLSRVNQAVGAIKDIDGWAVKVDEFLDESERKQTNKLIIGKELAFRDFAMNKSHRGIPLNILLSHFLRETPQVQPKRGEMFIRGGGGEKVQRKDPKKITDSTDAERLRKTDPREYKRRLQAGQIDLSVD